MTDSLNHVTQQIDHVADERERKSNEEILNIEWEQLRIALLWLSGWLATELVKAGAFSDSIRDAHGDVGEDLSNEHSVINRLSWRNMGSEALADAGEAGQDSCVHI